MARRTHDVFISHAWEDKDAIARPLAEELRQRGFEVWYDEFALTIGDPLRRTIDRGLNSSRFGVVILSHKFFAKEWPQRELAALTQLEVSRRRKVILPIWHDVTHREVMRFSPELAERVALRSSEGLAKIADKIAATIVPSRTRDQKKSARSGAAVREPADNWVTKPPSRRRFGLPRPDEGLDQIAPQAPPAPPARVLVVDDDPFVRALMADLLAGEGYFVMQESDGEAALRALDEGEPDVIVLDLILPLKSGREVLVALKGNSRTRDVPVLGVSASPRILVSRDVITTVDSFMGKPFDLAELVSQVKRLVAKRRRVLNRTRR